MTKKEQAIINLVADRVAANTDSITRESLLVQDLGFDSLDEVELLIELEDFFSIHISDDQAESFEKVGDIVDFIENNT
jgi:acyl carrier protein